jgi:hypothetical protein
LYVHGKIAEAYLSQKTGKQVKVILIDRAEEIKMEG